LVPEPVSLRPTAACSGWPVPANARQSSDRRSRRGLVRRFLGFDPEGLLDPAACCLVLAIDALRIGLEQYVNTVSRPLGDLGGGTPALSRGHRGCAAPSRPCCATEPWTCGRTPCAGRTRGPFPRWIFPGSANCWRTRGRPGRSTDGSSRRGIRTSTPPARHARPRISTSLSSTQPLLRPTPCQSEQGHKARAGSKSGSADEAADRTERRFNP
jgi:hypothetical protein